MNIARSICITALAISVTGCATILGGGSSQALGISSDPVGARFTVKSSSGIQMASGAAPQTVTLPRKNEYQIELVNYCYPDGAGAGDVPSIAEIVK